MRIMKSILIVFITLLSVGCSKDEGCGCTIISLDANISLKNNAGEDLLDPDNPNSYKKRDIKTYHLIDGEQKRAGQYDNLYEDEEGVFRYSVIVNYEGNDEYPITYIDWNETDRDTIKYEIYRTNNQTRAIKFWYNGELIWDAENENAPEFTIIK